MTNKEERREMKKIELMEKRKHFIIGMDFANEGAMLQTIHEIGFNFDRDAHRIYRFLNCSIPSGTYDILRKILHKEEVISIKNGEGNKIDESEE